MTEITNAERLDRLEHAERFLRGWKKYTKYCVRPVKRFDIGDFYYECDTAACAAGGMALHPWFIERGLTLRVDGIGFGSVEYLDAAHSFEACEWFFGITSFESGECFSSSSNTTVEDVADKIHALIVKYREAEA